MAFNVALHRSTKSGRFLSLLLLATLIVHPVAFAVGADTSLSVYTAFVVYLFLLGFTIINKKWFVRRSEILLICIACIGCIIGAATGIQAYGDSGIGSAVGYLLGLLAILSFGSRLNKADVSLLLYIVMLFGFAAALYAFVFQMPQWVNVLSGNRAGSNSWRYFSFFGQRNRFAACLYLSIVCGVVLFALTRRKKFAVVVVFLLFQIIITNSRTALVAALISVFVFVCFNSKSRLLIGAASGCAILVAISMFSEDLGSYLGVFFSHYGGFDSASVRTDMWGYGISELMESGMWLFGFGSGTQNIALTPYFEVSSFHNMYIELLFEGGVIKFGSYLVLIASSIYCAKKNEAFSEWNLFRSLYLPLLISWLAFSVLEAGATPFSTTFFSFLMSVLLFILPRCCSVNVVLEEELAAGLASADHGDFSEGESKRAVIALCNK